MPEYCYKCPGGFKFTKSFLMAEAPRETVCPCQRGIATRVFLPHTIIVRVPNYSASPDSPEYWKGLTEDPDHQGSRPVKITFEILTAEEARKRCCGEGTHAEVSEAG